MEKALKRSRQREHLIELLQGTKCHPDANWIFMEMRKRFHDISLATVYRNLKLLSKTGQIIKLDVGKDSEHYDITTKQHYHFVCEKCSSIDDIEMPVLEWAEKDLSDKIGAKVKRHTLIFYGICASCRTKGE